MNMNSRVVTARRLGIAALVAADGAVLGVAAPAPVAFATGLAAPHAWVARIGADHAAVIAAGAGLWCVAAWLGLGLLVAVAGRLPGAVGALARTTARRVLPAAVWPVAAAAIGVGAMLMPAAAVADTPGPPTGRGASGPSVAGPVLTDHLGGGPVRSGGVHPRSITPRWPSDAPEPAPDWPTSPTGRTDPARPAPHPHHRPPADPGHPGDHTVPLPPTIVVRPGDSLWRLAADRLGSRATPARVAAAWPRWYAANRRVIGADPNLIHPGVTLHAPASVRQEAP
jgi:resuscitation-promoting factor RpfA